jgi:hypothetical protein
MQMSIDRARPDLDVWLGLDAYAPRAARFHVGQVDKPSPDLRDAVMLLTSELVTRAVQQSAAPETAVELRAWMPAEVVRVELLAPAELLRAAPSGNGADYGLMLIDQIADRWSLDAVEGRTCMWFEIDRHLEPVAAGRAVEPENARARVRRRARRMIATRHRTRGERAGRTRARRR